jgi:serine protease Do
MTRRFALLLTAFVVGCASMQAVPQGDAPPRSFAPAVGAGAPNRAGIAATPDFVALVKRAGTGVVNIHSRGIIRGAEIERALARLTPQDPLYDFLRRYLPSGAHDYQARDAGAGFVLSDDGYIVTNAHLVAYMDEVTVKLTDKREFKAKVVGVDRRTDIALLKVDARGLSPVAIGDPSRLQVGDWVAAIGSPFGFDNSVTAGIVSAKGRSIPDETYVPLIQTDVAVNPGNSGGPLFNLRGEVIGINSMIYTGSGGYMGVSFAVPIDLAIKVADELRRAGKVTRGRLGVEIQDVTPDLARSFALGQPLGALVTRIEAGSPAQGAGLAPGDIILKVGDAALENSNDLPRIVGLTSPGATVVLEVWRRGAIRHLAAIVGELPGDRPRQAAMSEEIQADRLGLVLSELTPSQRDALHTEGGLLVRDVRGSALRAGIEQGDVIVALNDTMVNRVADFNQALDAVASGHLVALLVLREGELAYVPVRFGA